MKSLKKTINGIDNIVRIKKKIFKIHRFYMRIKKRSYSYFILAVRPFSFIVLNRKLFQIETV